MTLEASAIAAKMAHCSSDVCLRAGLASRASSFLMSGNFFMRGIAAVHHASQARSLCSRLKRTAAALKAKARVLGVWSQKDSKV